MLSLFVVVVVVVVVCLVVRFLALFTPQASGVAYKIVEMNSL